jgi:hypothetical protein
MWKVKETCLSLRKSKKDQTLAHCGQVKNPFWLFGHDQSHHLICTLFILCKVWMNLTKTILKDKQHPCCLCSINEKGTLFLFFFFFLLYLSTKERSKRYNEQNKGFIYIYIYGKRKKNTIIILFARLELTTTNSRSNGQNLEPLFWYGFGPPIVCKI